MKFHESKPDVIEKLSEGCQKLANNVGATMGPKGRNVLLDAEDEDITSTKDGVTVAEFFELQDKFEDAGNKVIKQSAVETNDKAGDGTTTSTILANSIFQQSIKYILSSRSVTPKILKNCIEDRLDETLDFVDEVSRPIMGKEDVRNIATISSNGDEDIGKMIAEAVDKVGKDGSIVVEESGKITTNVEFVEGYQFGAGFASSEFINDERNSKVYYEDKNPLIFVTDHKVDDVREMMELLGKAKEDGRPLVFVASDIKGKALSALILNNVRNDMDVAAVKAPYYGERRKKFLGDLAMSVGAKFVSKDRGDRLQDVGFDDLGACDSIEITQGQTTIVGGKGSTEQIQKHVEGLREEVERKDDIEEAERVQDRITRLASGVAVIKVGASTRVELVEKKHRIEDALEAVRSAQEEGTLPGGGVVLLEAASKIDLDDYKGEERIASDIFKRSLEEPIRQMCRNADETPEVIMSKIEEEDDLEKGYDLMNGEICDLYESGIIDPTKVTKSALQNAVSSAVTLIMTNSVIVEEESISEE